VSFAHANRQTIALPQLLVGLGGIPHRRLSRVVDHFEVFCQFPNMTFCVVRASTLRLKLIFELLQQRLHMFIV